MESQLNWGPDRTMRRLAYLLSLVLVFMVPWENAFTFGEWGTLSRVVGILTAAVWLFSLVITGRLRRPHAFHLAVFVLLLWVTAGIFWSLAIEQTIQSTKTYFQLALLAWMLWDLYTTPESLTAASQSYVLGCYVTIGSTIYNFVTGAEFRAYSEDRYAGAGLNAVDLVLILALALPVALHLAVSPGNGVRYQVTRIVNLAYIPASLYAMSLTGSRTSLFVILPFCFYALFAAKQLKPVRRFLVAGFLVLSITVVLLHIPESSLERLGTASSSISQMDLGGRVPLWRSSARIFVKHPLLGVGSGALHPPAQIGHVVHNTFLSIATELGVIGFVLFSVVLAIAFRQAFTQARSMAWLWLTVLGTWVLGAFSLNFERNKQTWFFLALVLISSELFPRRGSVRHADIRNDVSVLGLSSPVTTLSIDHPRRV